MPFIEGCPHVRGGGPYEGFHCSFFLIIVHFSTPLASLIPRPSSPSSGGKMKEVEVAKGKVGEEGLGTRLAHNIDQ